MAPASSSSATATSVQVALRIRPQTEQDDISIPKRFQRSVVHAASPNTVSVDTSPAHGLGNTASPSASSAAAKKQQTQLFSFDQVHQPETSQFNIFTTTAQPLVSRFLDGFNCTILAYGQTSSGKTYTMTGADLDADPADATNRMGIIPRAVSLIFSNARKLKEDRNGAWNYTLKASFIEVYNEDLIDLLGMDDGAGGRREVQIREDKDGHIIWGGLREVNVKGANEVMSLIRQGTSIRRTNETDMNAQSSRSHAIFSLTLTQRKYKGSSPPPRSPSPLGNGRSPSRLARPGSLYSSPPSGASRVGSPTFGRPATPSFAAAMGRGGLRPSSALGHSGDRLHPSSAEDDAGEWVTVTSKFHFVDLAGSERLKRTAAAGDRVKEGISINSGLLALGNVISALGDPSRSRTATHIPYRDSKLTRLLQDSLGGNAHTLMIACISAAEFNLNETVNTLKYANRARNIKNHAVLNEKEEGWDDLEWLQTTVTRLRKELKGLKEGGVIPLGTQDKSAPEAPRTPSKQEGLQMTQLRATYEDLRAKYVERTEELTRLRRELGERQRSSTGGAVGGMAKYEEIVGPIIEEYEKTIATMEAELNLNRAALRHTNDLVEEKEEELAAVTERHAATELYVEELRARVSKLSERETSTEAYIRDLEEKIKNYDETATTSSESMTDLKREVTRFRDAESHSGKYIAELEARLSRSDESIIELQQTVERLESECDRRQNEVENLQSRLDGLRQDGDSWRNDLEQREQRVRELEVKMAEWEKKRKETNEERIRLGNVVGKVVQARKSFEDVASISTTNDGTDLPPTPTVEENLADALPSAENKDASAELRSLQETHQATLADLSTITAKYRDALREISDLASQIQEAKLSNTSVAEDSAMDSPAIDKAFDAAGRRRRPNNRQKESVDSTDSSQKRLFFRHAASADSLRARSLSQSQSLSQELFSVHSRKTSSSSHGTSSYSPTHSPSQTLAYLSGSRPNLSISLPNGSHSPGERSVVSLEQEIMRLQEVLRERETEITHLEISLKEAQEIASLRPLDGEAPVVVSGPEHSALLNPDLALSPKTINQFDHIRQAMVNGNGHVHQDSISAANSDTEESLDRLNELMLSMAQKESSHKEAVDALNDQLAQVQRQLDDLTTLSRDQAMNMSTEMEGLRRKHEEDFKLLEEVRTREASLLEALESAKATHSTEIEELRNQHLVAMQAKGNEITELVERLKTEHQNEVDIIRKGLSSASAALETARRDHEEQFGKLQADHEKDLAQRLKEASDALAKVQDEHEKRVSKLQAEHEEVLKQRDAQLTADLHRTEEEYYNALTKIRSDHAETLQKHTEDLDASLERLKEQHASELRMAEIAKEGSVSESQSAQATALKELQEAHAEDIARKETAFKEEIESLKTAQLRSLKMKEDEHVVQMDRLRLEYESSVAKLKEEWRIEAERLNAVLKDADEKSNADTKDAQQRHETALREAEEKSLSLIEEHKRTHDEQLKTLASNHELSMKEAIDRSEKQIADVVEIHAHQITQLQDRHKTEIEEINAKLSTAREDQTKAIEALKHEHDASLAAERQEHAEVVAALEQKLQQDLDALQFTSKTLAEEKARLEASITDLRNSHSEELAAIQAKHEQTEHDRVRIASSLASLQEEHQSKDSDSASRFHDLLAEHSRVTNEMAAMSERHAQELSKLQGDHELLQQELNSHKVAAEEFSSIQERTREDHERALAEKDAALDDVHQTLANTAQERDDLEAEVLRLRDELDNTKTDQSKLVQEASKRQSLVEELERHRSVLADLQDNLQKVKDEKDAIQVEKTRAESMVRDLQAQIARSASPPAIRSPIRANGLPAIKLPPPTPPPSIPPPPAPALRTATTNSSVDSTASPTHTHTPSTLSQSVSSRDSSYESPTTPSTSLAHAPLPSPSSGVVSDSKLIQKLDQQTKQIEEQEVMIKTLNKQLTHCESDLQTHMDLVATLEASLGESEKNLRKARMHATELARERDTLNTRVQSLQTELTQTKQELATVRKSIVEEKQSLEQRLDEERRAKERARQQLDARMDELQKRKSKFACL